ncbi:MAG: hypothetical protein ACREFL_19075, partial [Stellaceae bacterium]
MLQFKAHDFVAAASHLQHIRSTIIEMRAHEEATTGQSISDAVAEVFTKALRHFLEPVAVLGTKITRMAAAELISSLDDQPRPTLDEFDRRIGEIQSTLRRELTQRVTFALEDAEQLLFQPERPLFGKEFDDRFRTRGTYELEEAAKCLALARP